MNDEQMKSISTTPETTGNDKQQTTKLAYRFMYDLVAKMVFSQNPDLLQNLVASLLKIDQCPQVKKKINNLIFDCDEIFWFAKSCCAA